MRQVHGDGGNVVAESAMIIALVTLLCGTILQLGVVIYTKNTMMDAASEGARHAALADRNLEDGQRRTSELLSAAVPLADNAAIDISKQVEEGMIVVTVTHKVPMLGFLAGPIPLSVTAQAHDLTP